MPMKPSSAPPTRQAANRANEKAQSALHDAGNQPTSGKPAWKLTPGKAWTCLVINQAATPGLGSIAGKRFITGTLQLLLSVVGFALAIFWIFRALLQNPLREAMGDPALPPCTWAGIWGSVLFVGSWLWSWITSLSLMREARLNAPLPSSIPPKL